MHFVAKPRTLDIKHFQRKSGPFQTLKNTRLKRFQHLHASKCVTRCDETSALGRRRAECAATHHLLQGGAASKRAGEECEAVDEGGEELAGQRRQDAPGEHGDQVGDDVGDAHRLRILDLDPEDTETATVSNSDTK